MVGSNLSLKYFDSTGDYLCENLVDIEYLSYYKADYVRNRQT